jgi:hypothetical protein
VLTDLVLEVVLVEQDTITQLVVEAEALVQLVNADKMHIHLLTLTEVADQEV